MPIQLDNSGEPVKAAGGGLQGGFNGGGGGNGPPGVFGGGGGGDVFNVGPGGYGFTGPVKKRYYASGRDNVPIMASAGEKVMNNGVTQNPEINSFLDMLNAQGQKSLQPTSSSPQHMMSGGTVRPGVGGGRPSGGGDPEMDDLMNARRLIRLLLSLDDAGGSGKPQHFASGGTVGGLSARIGDATNRAAAAMGYHGQPIVRGEIPPGPEVGSLGKMADWLHSANPTGLEAVPDALMGFRSAGREALQRGFSDMRGSEYPVHVTLPSGQIFEDAVKGANPTHALEVAKRNWPGAEVRLNPSGAIQHFFYGGSVRPQPLGQPAGQGTPGNGYTYNPEGGVTGGYNPADPYGAYSQNRDTSFVGQGARQLGAYGQAGAYDPHGDPVLMGQLAEQGNRDANAYAGNVYNNANIMGADPAQAASLKLRALASAGQGVSDTLGQYRTQYAANQDQFGKNLYSQLLQGNQGTTAQTNQARLADWLQGNQQGRANQAGGGFWGQLGGKLAGGIGAGIGSYVP